MIRSILSLAQLLIAVGGPALMPGDSASSGPPASVRISTEYDFHFEGSKVGTLRITRHRRTVDGRPAIESDSFFLVRVKQFLFRYSLEARERTVVDPDGLLDGAIESTENRNKTSIKIRREGSSLRVDYRGDGEEESFFFPDSQYDVTSAEYAGLTVCADSPERTLRILDLDFLTVGEVTYRFDGEEPVTAGGKQFACRRILFRDKSGHGRRWLAEDAAGPLLVKEEGEDEDGPYSLMLTSYQVRRSQVPPARELAK